MANNRCTGPVRRREFLQAGALALGGMTLPQLLAARADAGQTNAQTSVILLYMHGGPSQLETYDLKPDAPSSYRSVFNPIHTNVPGIDICEHMPLQAKLADKFAVVRSVHHTMSSHSDGGIEMLTGKTPTRPDPASQSKSEHPDLGHYVSRVRGLGTQAMPPYVAMPRSPYMTLPSYLGVHHRPFTVGDPSVKNFTPPSLKLAAGMDGKGLANRQALLNQLDQYRSGGDLHGDLLGSDRFRALAFQMLTSQAAAQAFDLDKESDDLRNRYGRHVWGQSCLLARRLAQAGVGVVSLYINTPKTGQEFTNWDDHISNAGRPGHFAKFMKLRLQYFDQALSALIEDIYTRDLDRQIMVVAMGEFGRTPRLSVNSTGVGRNHWPQACSVFFSGGGLRTGQMVGATNSKAEFPTERPYTPKDILATIYRHLGVDYRRNFLDRFGRPVPILYEGEPIRELI